MADETWRDIWFVKSIGTVIHALLFDKDASMGWAVLGLGYVSLFFITGGVIPVTNIVIPLPERWKAYYVPIGSFCALLTVRLANGARHSKVAPELVGLVEAIRKAQTAPASPVIRALTQEASVVAAVEQESTVMPAPVVEVAEKGP